MTRAFIRFLVPAATIAIGIWAWSSAFRTTVDAPVSFAEAAAQTPWREADLWLAPAETAGSSELAQGVEFLRIGQAADALPLLTKFLADPHLAPYVRLYVGRAQLALLDHERAVTAARHVIDATPRGYLGESARWLLGDAFEGAGQWSDAVAAWQELAGLEPASPAAVHQRLALAAENAGNVAVARDAWTRLYYDWPASAEATAASAALARLQVKPGAGPYARELARAVALYGARRYADAHAAFDRLAPRATAQDRALVALRLAQCDVLLQRYARGLQGLDAFLKRPGAEHREEAAFSRLAALRGLRRADYPTQVGAFVRAHDGSALAETALNDLATFHILASDDAAAASVFTNMFARYPNGAYADRAAWRAGWWAYRAGDVRETIRLFESASTNLRRADYRPSWLYWTARSYERLKQLDTARVWYLRTIADYRHSYYGRAAISALSRLPNGRWTDADVVPLRDPARALTAGVAPANAAVIQRLLSAGLWDDAVAELRRTSAGANTPMVEATIAYALNRKGELRPGITAMRRAYPQFMSDGGEQLPERLKRVIFPVAYGELIEKYAQHRGLDRYLVTALVAQESTFQADVRSVANAWGLMQLLPSTGQRYAAKVGVAPFSTSRLTEPETNVRLGTAYLADLLERFKDEAQALAAYNAGENRVSRWRNERPGLPRDEFIDDIPFPETQNYVKRIIGTAEDYREIYGSGSVSGGASR